MSVRADRAEPTPASEHEPRESYIRTLAPRPASSALRANSRVEATARTPSGATAEAKVATFVVQRLVEAIELAGVPRQDALRAAGIPEEALADVDTGIPRHLIERMCAHALEATAVPALGLHWAERVTVQTFGPVSHTLMHTTSLRQGLELLQQYGRLFCDQPFFALEEQGDTAVLRVTMGDAESPAVRRFEAEMCLSCFLTVVRKHGGQVQRVCFAYPAPDDRAEYARVFGSLASFDQPFTGLVFNRATLDFRNPHSDSEVRTALTGVLERRLVRATEEPPYAVRVRELLGEQAPRRLKIGAAARELGLSERSLRRRLSAEGASFREIQHGVCASMAQRLLQERRLTIQETAYAMGFSDASAFHRAFKRWTGTTPRAFGGR